jgi:dynein heavy chain
MEGKVEIYMQTLLDACKVSLFQNLKRSLVRYAEYPRKDWVMFKNSDLTKNRPADPAQIILLVLAVFYVQEVEDAFVALEENPEAMKEYSQKQISQLSELIILTQSKITKPERQRIMACITMDAHSRDVIQKTILYGYDDVNCFWWQSQLKHKFRDPPPQASFTHRDPHLRGENGERAEIAICDAILPYDYEYLGNGFRLVITPLTDRIYVTATQALNLKMGCAPAGPAGTGKTETTKDLSSALAKCVYVVNCSPEMDYKGLGNIFKGVASSGAWICFDEFNRLVPEVLSVCTVQFKSVCDGCKAETDNVVIEGDRVTLDATCGAFITMNPGYLGRSELPEGLKALFRPITVMVPDLVLICENFLMAEGFIEAKTLASKFYGLYSLLGALLSKQLHYDWGLRAVKSVLVVAGSFKRAEPGIAEEALLMRALRDFNIPKIVQEDEVIFFGLLGDLFPFCENQPRTNPPRKVNEELEDFVKRACERLGNCPDPDFMLKCVQFEELLAIRHCVFLMGPAAAGKTQCWKTLAAARGLRGDTTKAFDINPKSVTTKELYGYISMASREWKDGLLSSIMRSVGEINNEDPKWIMLDGDLDANWIESMNSVMDDNRMLTLASNERIPLKTHMRMVFEIRDLKYATPATVSRAGILYISTASGSQWRSLISSWLNQDRDGDEYSDEAKEVLRHCFDTYIAATLFWMKVNVSCAVPLQDMTLVQTLLFMLDGTLTEHARETPESIETVFSYCAVWAVGSCLTIADDGADHRSKFSEWWRSEWKTVQYPNNLLVFDYWLNLKEMQFDNWTESPYFFEIDYDSRKTAMQSVTVPTPDSCSVTFWMTSLVNMQRAVMLAGPAGTGKTQMVMGMLTKLNPDEKVFQDINFNFYTTSQVLQTTMCLPLEKKTGTTFGPPGNRKLVYFVDDLNLPEVDKYNTQSAIALLRQQMEYEHVYDLAKLSTNPLKFIKSTQMIACLNPTAGSFEIDPRLQRWFATFAISLPGPTSLLIIYQTFLKGHLQHNGFTDDVVNLVNAIIKGALGLHAAVSGRFRKTAANFHYEFNIRHIANVFQGLLVAQPKEFKSPEKMVQLWLHESERVYGDRLVSPEDLTAYYDIASSQSSKCFSFSVARFFAPENADPLVFCHFADGIGDGDKVYNQIENLTHMSDILVGALHEYNETNAAMDLVLFDDAMKHVARISRIVLNEGGHALCVGVGGSGKQSLSRLAAFICDYTVKQIVISSTYSINDLKDDLKVMYNQAGIKDEGVMFLLTDSQIVNERFLIFINDLLASGNIPDLYATDEVDAITGNGKILSAVKAAGLLIDKKNCWDYFIGRIRTNLHVVLAFSPVGDDFRTRARKFPALVNCTVIDWFQPWPENALFRVGQKFMASVELGESSVRDGVEAFLPYSFLRVNEEAKEFHRIERRFVYTTPKSFLELLKLYSGLLGEKFKQADFAIDRLANGLQKLKETAESVVRIEENLKVDLEAAAEKKMNAEGIAEVVTKERAVVEVETEKGEKEAVRVGAIQKDVAAQAKSTQADLDAATPAVNKAMAALKGLDAKQISEVKGSKAVPSGVGEVFGATMCLLAGVLDTIKHKNNVCKGVDQWDVVKKQCLVDVKKYMEKLLELKTWIDESRFPPVNIVQAKKLSTLEVFDPEIIKGKNSAAAGLCEYVINIITYHDIVVDVEPKRRALRRAQDTLRKANKELATVQKKVADLQAKLAKLTAELQSAETDKKEAQDTVERGQRKLDLANRLTSALEAENQRWAVNIDKLIENKAKLIGDVLLASAFISYVGPFTKPFRDSLMVGAFTPFLQKAFEKATVSPLSDESNPLLILTNEAEMAQWQTDFLPADRVSMENGAVVCNSSRWPLVIDPQLQGIRWLRAKEGQPERHLQIVRLSQKDVIRKLTGALENGHSLIIENLGETLDAVLNPVIQRATIKKGRTMYVKLGDAEVEFHPDFRLFLHTKLSNPHYPPEIQAETTLVNFTVTRAGLEDQILVLVVRKQRKDLADLSEDLVRKQNGFKIKMTELEDSILTRLAHAEGDLTEDIDLIEGLESTKKISVEIEKKSEAAHKTQGEIHITSEKYRPVANRSALLFFLMNDLVKMHTYYIYSLSAFTSVFYRGIDKVMDEIQRAMRSNRPSVEGDPDGVEMGEEGGPNLEEGEVDEEDMHANDLTDAELEERCRLLIESITITVFEYIRRGLFVRDKLTVAALFSLSILVNDKKLQQEDVDYLVAGKIAPEPGDMGMDLATWMPDATWPKVKALEDMKRFKSIGNDMRDDSEEWLLWFDAAEPENTKMPGDYGKRCSVFEKLIILRALRPDRVTEALRTWIVSVMGAPFVEQPTFSMEQAYSESNPQTPVFFVLFAGVDPTPWVEGLGKELGITEEAGTFRNISMGQGQEKPAEAVVSAFAKTGGWVMLQNCHLMQSWVPQLERLLEIVSEDAHDNFRCFISAEPPPLAYMRNMPESLMQSCIKVANEAPADIRSNLRKAWTSFGQAAIDDSTKPNELKGCVFALCWFHSIVLGRRRFGQQGWSRKYSFNTGDLEICIRVTNSYLEANTMVPWDDLRYLFGEIFYGGHITDAWDRRTANTYLEVLFTKGIFEQCELGPGFNNPVPEGRDYEAYDAYVVEHLPPESPPQFGLHPNAEIGYLENATLQCFNDILNIGGGSSSGGGDGDDGSGGGGFVKNILDDLLSRLPEDFVMVIILEKAKPLLEDLIKSPFVVVALQECTRMNTLLSEIRRTLVELDKGLQGQLNMSDSMEDLVKAFTINQWPGRNPFSKCTWEKLAWPSMKNLVFQFSDMLKRVTQLVLWTETLDRPRCLWLPGLFSPSAYLTAILQTTGRMTGWALDKMTTETHITTISEPQGPSLVKTQPENGVYVHGLFLEGARWPVGDEVEEKTILGGAEVGGALMDGRLKELLPQLPIVYIRACEVEPSWEASGVGYLRHVDGIYECPVYFTTFRGPTYVFLATLQTVDPKSKWVLAGTAVIMQTNDA